MLFIDIIYLFINWANKDACSFKVKRSKVRVRGGRGHTVLMRPPTHGEIVRLS